MAKALVKDLQVHRRCSGRVFACMYTKECHACMQGVPVPVNRAGRALRIHKPHSTQQQEEAGHIYCFSLEKFCEVGDNLLFIFRGQG